MLSIYRVIIWIALIIGSPYLLAKALMGRHGIRERFGSIPQRSSSARLFWFHAASVGELKIISSLLPLISESDNTVEFAISTTTITGRRRAEELFGQKAIVFLQPLELMSAIRRAVNRIRPEKLIVIETELWPLMLTTARAHGVDMFLVNARMSRGSFKKYRILKKLFESVLNDFTMILTQSPDDADRFKRLGAVNVSVTGNLKFDQVLDYAGSDESKLYIQNPGKLVVVAGSIRRGEDEILAEVISRTIGGGLDVGFILVPRHMKEIDDMARVLSGHGIEFKLRTDYPGNEIVLDRIMIVNTMGELRDFYKIGDLAFVGGSLVPVGGHDPLEPAALGKPVVFGPYMENAAEAAEILLRSGGAVEIRQSDDLLKIIRESVGNRSILESRGEKCREAILSVTGASRKVAGILTGKTI